MSLSNFPVILLIYLLFISWNKTETCSPLKWNFLSRMTITDSKTKTKAVMKDCLKKQSSWLNKKHGWNENALSKMFCMSKKNLLLVLSVSNWWMQENCKTNTTFQHKQLDYGNWIYQYTLHTPRILNTHYECYEVLSWKNAIVVGAKAHYLNPWIWIHEYEKVESSKGTHNSFLYICHKATLKTQILLEEFDKELNIVLS